MDAAMTEDADAKLIEAMARALMDVTLWHGAFDNERRLMNVEQERDHFRRLARAALAVVRQAEGSPPCNWPHSCERVQAALGDPRICVSIPAAPEAP